MAYQQYELGVLPHPQRYRTSWRTNSMNLVYFIVHPIPPPPDRRLMERVAALKREIATKLNSLKEEKQKVKLKKGVPTTYERIFNIIHTS